MYVYRELIFFFFFRCWFLQCNNPDCGTKRANICFMLLDCNKCEFVNFCTRKTNKRAHKRKYVWNVLSHCDRWCVLTNIRYIPNWWRNFGRCFVVCLLSVLQKTLTLAPSHRHTPNSGKRNEKWTTHGTNILLNKCSYHRYHVSTTVFSSWFRLAIRTSDTKFDCIADWEKNGVAHFSFGPDKNERIWCALLHLPFGICVL